MISALLCVALSGRVMNLISWMLLARHERYLSVECGEPVIAPYYFNLGTNDMVVYSSAILAMWGVQCFS